MAIKIRREQLKSLKAAGLWIGELTGKPVPYQTVWNWANIGVRGEKLEVVRIGGTAYTSIEAMERFFEATTERELEVVPAGGVNEMQHERDLNYLRSKGYGV